MSGTKKNKKKIGVKKKDYPKVYQQEIEKLKEEYNVDNKNEYQWRGYPIIETLFYKYFSEKYKMCIFDLNINLTDDSEDVIIEKIISCVEKIKHCLNLIISKPKQTTHEKNTDIIVIPFIYFFEGNAHRNLLVYRTTTNPPMLEWFEPHGKCFMLDPNDPNTIKINNIVDDFHRILSSDLHTRIKMDKPDIICPSDMGVQAIEARCKSLPDNSGGGYCALWSLFFLEYVLKFKDMTVSELNQRLLEKYHTPVKLRKLMFSYSKKLSNILEKQTKKMELNDLIFLIKNNYNNIYELEEEDEHLVTKIKKHIDKNNLNYSLSNKNSTTPFFHNLSSGTEYYLSENGKSIKSSTRSSKNKSTSFTKNV